MHRIPDCRKRLEVLQFFSVGDRQNACFSLRTGKIDEQNGSIKGDQLVRLPAEIWMKPHFPHGIAVSG